MDPSGTFCPDASIALTPALRTSGLLYALPRESGLHAYSPSPHIVSAGYARHGNQPEKDAPAIAAAQDAVLAHSRAMYARPRLVVEEEIARLNGWPWPPASVAERLKLAAAPTVSEETPTVRASAPLRSAGPDTPDVGRSPKDGEDLRRQLRGLGVPIDIAERLVQKHAAGRILRQISWLPYRRADTPSRLLVAAIENDYAAPRTLPESTQETNS